ncbi:MAG: hypothetical protein ACFFCQ_07105 [Promethearchaeota archaeon]
MRIRWKDWIRGGMLWLLLLGIFSLPQAVKASTDILVEPKIEEIWKDGNVQKIALSGDHLFLLMEDKKIHCFENEVHKSVFHLNYSIYSFVALNQTLIIPSLEPAYARFTAVNFENYSKPHVISSIKEETTGDITSMSVYGQYMYSANWEWGFPIFDYSNVSHPKLISSVPLSNWHCEQLYIISHYGFFSGDFQTGLYELNNTPTQPVQLKTIRYGGSQYDYEHHLWFAGRPAVSSKYFVINHCSNSRLFNVFHIILRKNVSSIMHNVTYAKEFAYGDCALIEENILLVGRATNEIYLFEITSSGSMEFIRKISLGNKGSIKEIYPIEGLNEFYIADGEKGLLKLSLFVTRGKDTMTILITVLVLSSICVTLIIIVRRYRGRSSHINHLRENPPTD